MLAAPLDSLHSPEAKQRAAMPATWGVAMELQTGGCAGGWVGEGRGEARQAASSHAKTSQARPALVMRLWRSPVHPAPCPTHVPLQLSSAPEGTVDRMFTPGAAIVRL